MNGKKKVLYIEANRDGSIGGSYYSLLYLIQGLNKKKYEPYVLFCQDNVLIPEYKKITPHIYINDFDPFVSSPLMSFEDYIKWPYRFLSGIVWKQIKIRKIIKEIKPDLVHLNNGQNAMHEWVLACHLYDIKVVVHDRGVRPPYSFQTKLFVNLIDAVISISEYYKNYIITYKLPVKKLVRIYNGLNVKLFDDAVDLERVRILKEQYGLINVEHVVGIVGNIDIWKGQLIVVKAIYELKRHYPNIKCLIIGTVVKGAEEYKQELDNYILENKLSENIIFTGFIKDIPNIINSLDITIHASIEPEPFGRVILEGMAAKKPIVGTNTGGVPEIIIDGVTGLLVPMNDPAKLADAIRYYLSNKTIALEMASKGRQRLIDVFSTEKMVAETEKLYEDVFYGKEID